MDTRHKIVDTAAAAEAARRWREDGGTVLAVTGYFDVLLASHARELARVRNATPRPLLLAVLLPPPNPVLAPRARAETVAALGVVDYVVILGHGTELEGLLDAVRASVTARCEAGHARRFRQLVEHVHGLQTVG